MNKFLVIGASMLAISACSTDHERHYWQRNDPNSAIYLTGVKAQQMLEQDIATCVHEIIELTKLGDVRGQVPGTFQPLGSYDQKQATQQMSNLPRWDVPEYIKDLRVDHSDYHDFDGCMDYKGWSRVRYVGPQAEFRSQEIYDDTAEYSVRPKNPKTEAYNKEKDGLNNEEK